jgi:tRNA(fMet)-specific endonuclease VapC
MSFLLDTDICSAHLKGQGSLTHKFLQHTGHLHVSAISVGELYTWASRAKAPAGRLQGLLDFLKDVNVVDVTEVIARKFGEVRASLLDSGKTVPEMDLMIAATALATDFTLVTHNVSDFAMVPGLRIDDWLAP